MTAALQAVEATAEVAASAAAVPRVAMDSAVGEAVAGVAVPAARAAR